MKLALCISGHVRSGYELYPSFVKNILNPLKEKFDTLDIFISTWDTLSTKESWSTSTDKQNNISDRINHNINVMDLINRYKPVSIQIDEFDKLKNGFTNKSLIGREIYIESHRCSPEQMMFFTPMFWKIWTANERKKQYEREKGFKYDYCLRFRLDTYLLQPFNLSILDFENILFSEYITPNCCGDVLWWGSNEVMNIASDLWLHLPWFIENEPRNGPERILFNYLTNKGIQIAPIKNNLKFLREGDVEKGNIPKLEELNQPYVHNNYE